MASTQAELSLRFVINVVALRWLRSIDCFLWRWHLESVRGSRGIPDQRRRRQEEREYALEQIHHFGVRRGRRSAFGLFRLSPTYQSHLPKSCTLRNGRTVRGRSYISKTHSRLYPRLPVLLMVSCIFAYVHQVNDHQAAGRQLS